MRPWHVASRGCRIRNQKTLYGSLLFSFLFLLLCRFSPFSPFSFLSNSSLSFPAICLHLICSFFYPFLAFSLSLLFSSYLVSTKFFSFFSCNLSVSLLLLFLLFCRLQPDFSFFFFYIVATNPSLSFPENCLSLFFPLSVNVFLKSETLRPFPFFSSYPMISVSSLAVFFVL